MSYEFVTVTSKNVAQFVSLYISVFNSPPWNDGWTSESAHERLTTFSNFPTFHGLTLIHEGTPAGLVLGWGERWAKGWVFHIKEMAIASHFQRRGFGAALLTEFEHKLTRLGFTGVYLETGENTPAKEFYQEAGYSRFGVASLRKRLVT